MNIWLQTCEDARHSMKGIVSMLFDQRCPDLFVIGDVLSDFGGEADDKKSYTVACALYASSYRLAGSVKIIADTAMQASSDVDKLAKNGRGGIKKKVIAHQNVVKDFAEALQADCYNDLMHLTNEIEALLEHPFFIEFDGQKLHSCLQYHNGIIEKHMNEIFELGARIKMHPVMGINVANIGKLRVIHNHSVKLP